MRVKFEDEIPIFPTKQQARLVKVHDMQGANQVKKKNYKLFDLRFFLHKYALNIVFTICSLDKDPGLCM